MFVAGSPLLSFSEAVSTFLLGGHSLRPHYALCEVQGPVYVCPTGHDNLSGPLKTQIVSLGPGPTGGGSISPCLQGNALSDPGLKALEADSRGVGESWSVLWLLPHRSFLGSS